MDNMKILVFYASELDIPASGDSKGLLATSVEYLFYGENGEFLQPKGKVRGENEVGARRGKGLLDIDKFNSDIVVVPGVYDGTFEMTMNSSGKPVLKLVNIKYLMPAEIKGVPLEDGKK